MLEFVSFYYHCVFIYIAVKWWYFLQGPYSEDVDLMDEVLVEVYCSFTRMMSHVNFLIHHLLHLNLNFYQLVLYVVLYTAIYSSQFV